MTTPPTTPPTSPPTTTPEDPLPTGPPTTTPSAVSQDLEDLINRQWVVESFITVGAPEPVPVGSPAVLEFSADRVEVDTGCNTGSAPVTFGDGGQLTVGTLTMTEIACSDELAAFEYRIVHLLGLPTRWAIEGDLLWITPEHISDTGINLRDESAS